MASVYDASGAPVSSVKTSAAFDPVFGTATSTTDADGNTTTYGLDPATGHILNSVDAMQDKTAYEYASVETYDGTYGPGDLKSITDPNGNITKFLAYNAFGEATSIMNAVGVLTTRVYDARGRLTEESDNAGHKVTYTYDGLDRVLETIHYDDVNNASEPGGEGAQRVTYTYKPGGQVASVVNGLNQLTEYEYDSAGRLISQKNVNVVQADGSHVTITTTFGYDEAGNMVSKVDGAGIAYAYAYDGLNRLTTTTVLTGPADGPSNLDSSSTYNAVYKLTDTDIHNNVVKYEYDGLYRIAKTTLPVSTNPEGGTPAVVTSKYDATGDLLFRSDANGNGSTNTYDGAHRLTSVTDAVGNKTSYTYDKNGNVTSETHSNSGLKIVYSNFDGLNRAGLVTELVRQGGASAAVDTLVTKYEYDDLKNTVTVTDPRGIVTESWKDGLGRTFKVTTKTSDGDATSNYTYDPDGNLATVSDAQNDDIDVTYTYDGLDRKIKAVYVSTPDDQHTPTEEFYYDGDNRLIAYVDMMGAKFETKYDNLGRVIEQTVPNVAPGDPTTVTTYAYDDSANTMTETNADHSGSTKTEYDALGRVLKITDPLGNTLEYKYDGVNLRVKIDKAGAETDYTYDAINRVTKTEYREDEGSEVLQTIETAYDDKAGTTTTTTDPLDIKTVDQYDSLGRLVSEKVSNEDFVNEYKTLEITTTARTYDKDGNVASVTDANGHVTKYEYNDLNYLVKITVAADTPDEAVTQYTYDMVGNLLTVQGPRDHDFGPDTTNTYDARYRLTSTADALDDTTTYTHYENGNLKSEADARDPSHKTVYAYDALGNLVSVDERGRQGGLTTYTYDADRNLLSETIAGVLQATYTYDALDRLQTEMQPDGGVTRYFYDENGNVSQIIDAEGQQTLMTYDYKNRLETVTYSAALNPSLDYQPLSVKYDYDDDNNEVDVTRVELVGGVQTSQDWEYKYDKLDRLLSVKNPDDKTITYTYDLVGNRASMTDPDGKTTTYKYDAQNRIHIVTTAAGKTRYEYYPDGLLKLQVDPNGAVADYGFDDSYDAVGRLTKVVNRQSVLSDLDLETAGVDPGPEHTISTFEYTYDADGNRLTQTETHQAIAGGAEQTTTYEYDAFDRLSKVSYDNGASLAYTYDEAGNRKSEIGTDPSAPTAAVKRFYTYDVNGRLTKIDDAANPANSVTYTYDENGNRLSETTAGVTVKYQYNILNQLVWTTDQSGKPVTFDYDLDGIRIAKNTSTAQTNYLIDDGATLIEYDGTSGATLRKYDYGRGLISLTDTDPKTQVSSTAFYVVDGLGSTSELMTSSDAVQITYQFDAWGNIFNTVGASDNSKLYTGQQFDSDDGTALFRRPLLRLEDGNVPHPGQRRRPIGLAAEPQRVHLCVRQSASLHRSNRT